MKCKIHQNKKNRGQCLILPENKDMSELPSEIQKDFEQNSLKIIDIIQDKQLIALDPNEVLEHVKNKGFCIVEGKVKIQELGG